MASTVGRPAPVVHGIRRPGRRWRVPVPLVSLLAGVLTWEAYGRASGGIVIPPFSDVLAAWWVMVARGDLQDAFATSVQAFVVGFGLAVVAALLLGVVLGTDRELDHTLSPLLNALLALPSVAYIPLIVIWFGFGFAGRAAVIFEFTFLVMAMNVRAGIRGVDPSLREMAATFRLGRTRTFRSVMLPGALPSIFAGLRLGVGRAVKGLITAEILLALVGIGGLAKHHGNAFRIDFLMAVVVSVVVLALFLTALLERLDHRVNRWNRRSVSPKE